MSKTHRKNPIAKILPEFTRKIIPNKKRKLREKLQEEEHKQEISLIKSQELQYEFFE